MSSWSVIKWVGVFAVVAVLLFQMSEKPPEPEKADVWAPEVAPPVETDPTDRAERELLSAIARKQALNDVKRIFEKLDTLEDRIRRWTATTGDFNESELGQRLQNSPVAAPRLRPFLQEQRVSEGDAEERRETAKLIQVHLLASDEVASEYKPGAGVVRTLEEINEFVDVGIEKFRVDDAKFRQMIVDLARLAR